MPERMRLLGQLRAARLLLLLTLIGVMLLRALFLPATAVMMALLVRALEHAPAASGALGRAIPLLAAFGAVLLLGHVTETLAGPLQFGVKSQIDGAHRAEVTRLASASPGITALEQPHIQDLIRLASADPANWTERTPGDGAVAQLDLITRYLGMLASCAVLASYSPWLIPVLLVPALACWNIQRRRALGLTRVWVAGISEGRSCDYWKEVATSAAGGKELRVFGFGGWLVARSQRHLHAMFDPVWSVGQQTNRRVWAPYLLTAVPLAAAYAAVAAGTVHGHRSVAVETAVLGAGWSVYMAMGMLADAFSVEGALPGLRAYAELRTALDRPDTSDSAGPGALRRDNGTPPLVRFDAVCFRYPGSERAVLDQLDLEIRPGELLAIVGLNGAGKSTLIKLLTGLYEATAGRITADGADIRLGLGAWREQVAVVFQDFIHYHLTVRDNVVLGRGGQPPDRAAMAAAAHNAGLDGVIERLPAGWDTPLARSRTGGVDLSGGQWQQVVLARALYAVHSGAGILVLDEPTAHLDVHTESELFARLADRAGDVTVVLISHRLSTVRQADRIVLLDGGRISESGTHAELMSLDGAYARMFALQAARFSRGDDDRLDEGRPA